jgi:hypothetical protein
VQVQHTFVTRDPGAFDALSELHIWTDDFKQQRLCRRIGRPITVMLLRTFNLCEHAVLPANDEYWGCFSWGVYYLVHALALSWHVHANVKRSCAGVNAIRT